jgi:hypothetical protein
MALVTIKVSPHTRRMLRVLAAHQGTTLHQAVSDAVWLQIGKYKLKVPAVQGGKTATNGTKGKGAR